MCCYEVCVCSRSSYDFSPNICIGRIALWIFYVCLQSRRQFNVSSVLMAPKLRAMVNIATRLKFTNFVRASWPWRHYQNGLSVLANQPTAQCSSYKRPLFYGCACVEALLLLGLDVISRTKSALPYPARMLFFFRKASGGSESQYHILFEDTLLSNFC